MIFVRRHLDIFAIVLAVSFIFAFFAQPIFSGLPVSKVYLLANRDVLFSQFRDLQANIRWDSSLFQLAVPNYFVIAQTWRAGDLPLWNPYVGLGMPFIGDLQSCIFSPWRILGSFCPTIGFYNFQLFLQIIFCSTGCYMLGRYLQLSRISSFFVALAYPLAPHELSFLELLNGPAFTLYPWLILCFVRAAEKQNLLRLGMAAACTALIIFTGHALVAFTGILAASLLFLGFSVLVYKDSKDWQLNIAKATFALASLAFFSALLAAPVILPFLEFLQNGSCYKFTREQDVLPWQTLPYFMLHPGVGALSPTLGALAVPLAVAGAFVENQKRKVYFVLLASIASLYVVMCSLGPMALIANATPLRYVPGIYYVFVTTLLITLCAAFGVDALQQGAAKSKRCFFSIMTALVLTIGVPLLLHIARVDMDCVRFDYQMPVASLHFLYWLKDLAVSVAFLAFFILTKYSKISARVLAIAAVSLSLTGELIISSKALPIRPRFDFAQTDGHKFLMSTGERVAPIGFDQLVANANAVYGIRSLAIHNAMFHKRFSTLMKAAGLHVDDFNIMPDRFGLSRMLDLFSLAYLVSLSPAVSDDEELKPESAICIDEPVHFEQGITLISSKIGYNEQKREVLGHLKWHLPDGEKDRFAYIPVVADPTGRPIWFGGSSIIVTNPRKRQLNLRFNFSALVPMRIGHSAPFMVGLKVFDLKKVCFLKALGPASSANKELVQSSESRQVGDFIKLGSFSKTKKSSTSTQSILNRFELVREIGADNVRIYKNKNALPQAYLLRHIVAASSEEDALSKIRSDQFSARETAIVELDQKTGRQTDSNFCRWFEPVEDVNAETKTISSELLQNSETYPNNVFASPQVQRLSVNRVRVACAPPKPSFLVLTDFFYPGWVATIDGTNTPIYCSNYAMRGVAVPAGNHIVDFEYKPRSFYLGAALSAGLFVCLLLTITLSRRKRTD